MDKGSDGCVDERGEEEGWYSRSRFYHKQTLVRTVENMYLPRRESGESFRAKEDEKGATR